MLKYALAAIVAIGATTAAAHATPLGSAGGVLANEVRSAAGVDKVAYRRCWNRNGRRHCRMVRDERGYRYRNGDYYEHDAEKLPFGSQRWWDQMVRENRGGNPGGGGRN